MMKCEFLWFVNLFVSSLFVIWSRLPSFFFLSFNFWFYPTLYLPHGLHDYGACPEEKLHAYR